MASELLTLRHGRLDASPEEANYDPAALERLNEHYSSIIANGTIQAASYLLSIGGRIVAHAAMGKRTPDPDSPELLPDSIRKTYSVTKFVTAVAILQLADRGRLYLGQPVSSILPVFDTNLHKDITIEHLLTHTSGLRPDPGYSFEPYGLPWFEWFYREAQKRFPELTWLQVVLAGPLESEPGKEHHYSTAGYSVLGEVIAKVSGKSYEDYVREEIFEPLGMERSFFAVPESLRGDVCYTGDWERKGLSAGARADDDPPKAGNGMYSTLRDLWRLGQAMLNGGSLDGVYILSPSAVRLMTANRLSGVRMRGWGANEDDYRFGLGLSLNDWDLCSPGTYSHEGYGRSGLYVDPAEKLVFAYFAPSPTDYSPQSVVMPKAIVWSGLLGANEARGASGDSASSGSAPNDAAPDASASDGVPASGVSGRSAPPDYPPEAASRLDAHFQALIDSGKLQSASYLLARDGRIAAGNALGRLSYREDNDAPLETDSIRRIASITKLFTAVAVFQLIEQGKLHLKQPAREWIEEFDNDHYKGVEIWHLLTHTSGVKPDPGYFTEPFPFGPWEIRFAYEPDTEGPNKVEDEAEREKRKRTAWIRAALSGRKACEPGESWNYSSTGYSILGEIIARASGLSYDDYVMERIVKPLGMRRTFFAVPKELHAEVCVTNEWDEKGLEPRDRTYDGPRAGGGLSSTLEDLLRFGQMLLQGGTYEGVRILSRKSVERMTRNHFAGRKLFAFSWGARITAMPHGMGPGVSDGSEWLSPGSFGHEGAGRSKLVIDPERKAIGIFFVPSNDDWVPESIVSAVNLMWSGWR